MSENEKQLETMEEAIESIDASMKTIEVGSIIEGKVLSKNNDELVVNIELGVDGILSKQDVDELEFEKLSEGDLIKVYVVKEDDGEGNVKLSKTRADAVVVWDELTAMIGDDSLLEVKVKEVVKGGVVANYKGVRCFIPASQLSIRYVEDLNQYAGQTLQVQVIEVDKEKKRVILSRKAVEQKEAERTKQDLLSRISVGDRMDGKVVRLAPYGAFVDIGGVDGLVHVSELSWKRVKHPSEVVSEGDMIQVEVLKIDRETEKISLRLADVITNPWETVDELYELDQKVEGEVVRMLNFGAFVELESGIEGLLHVSQISEERINHPQDVLQLGQKVEVRITSISKSDQRLGLSMKDGVTEEVVDYEEYLDEEPKEATLGDLFGDKLKNFKFD